MQRKIKTLSKEEFFKAWEELKNSEGVLPEVDEYYEEIRNYLKEQYKIILDELSREKYDKKDYFKDYRFGLVLYEYFHNTKGFSYRDLSDNGFWRFMSVKVIPDIVRDRWDGTEYKSPTHYGSKRIWMITIWRFIHLSWQGTEKTTRDILSKSMFSTDTILNLEDRSGHMGTRVGTCRQIVRFFAKVQKNAHTKYDMLFRAIMKLNTAKLMVVEPSLVDGGEECYAKKLIEEVNVGVKKDVAEDN